MLHIKKQANIRWDETTPRIALAFAAWSQIAYLETTNASTPTALSRFAKLLIRLVTQHIKTVFISSHLLGEVERMATHVGIIHKGEMLFQEVLRI